MHKAIIRTLSAGIAAAANELIITEPMYNSTEADDVEWIKQRSEPVCLVR